ncbi:MULTISPECIES: hypothetical protein [unclassified Azospirillum]|uniref:hypothetical protein n=1 Tax=unclassified Azospirillum TaxID=2630922 RepID=UPI001304AECD|nr:MULTISPECIES: hypothetical protein [unclassified Azospirillum]
MPTPFRDFPGRPHYHQPRPDLLAGLKAKVMGGGGAVAATGRAASIGLEGRGIGKTTLACDLYREPT